MFVNRAFELSKYGALLALAINLDALMMLAIERAGGIISFLSVTVVIWMFLFSIRDERKRGDDASLSRAWRRSAALGGIVVGAAIMLCAYHPPLLASIPGMHVPLALAGGALVYIGIEVAFPRKSPPK